MKGSGLLQQTKCGWQSTWVYIVQLTINRFPKYDLPIINDRSSDWPHNVQGAGDFVSGQKFEGVQELRNQSIQMKAITRDESQSSCLSVWHCRKLVINYHDQCLCKGGRAVHTASKTSVRHNIHAIVPSFDKRKQERNGRFVVNVLNMDSHRVWSIVWSTRYSAQKE